jgi:hypothetical protein
MGGAFGLKGDSGSLVYVIDNEKKYGVGIFCGSDPTKGNYIMTPIEFLTKYVFEISPKN